MLRRALVLAALASLPAAAFAVSSVFVYQGELRDNITAAVKGRIGSLLRGDTEEMEKRIEKEAKQLEASAMRICDDLPGLLDTQQALAAAVPAFVPYAKMESSDIADCHEGGVAVLSDEEAKAPTEAQPEAAPADAPPAKAP